MSKVRVTCFIVLLSCLIPTLALAIGGTSTGAGNSSYLDRCEIPFPDTYEFHDHFANHQYLSLNEAIAHCREFTSSLPSTWKTANFMIHFGPSAYTDKWRAFTCLACVRYEHVQGPWEGHADVFTSLPPSIIDSISTAVAFYGGRVSQVQFITELDGETGEAAGGYEVTLVNVDTGMTGVVQIDPFSGQATVIREEPISDQP